jgi:YVTN family beta-propeller protein
VNRRSTIASVLAVTAVVCGGAVAAQSRMFTLLPTGWQIVKAVGRIDVTGTLPQGVTLSHDGKTAFIVEGGYQPPALRIIDAATLRDERVVPLKGAFGRALLDPNDDNVWVAGAGDNTIVHVDTANGAIDRTIAVGPDTYPTAIARSPDGTTLAVTAESSNEVVFINEAAGTVTGKATVGDHVSDVAYVDPQTVFVTAWGERYVDVVDTATNTRTSRIAVGFHPESLVVDGPTHRAYVAVTDDDAVATIDTAARKLMTVTPLGIATQIGASPNHIRLSPDAKRLYVSCGAANAVVALSAGDMPKVLGAVPSGWYPTDAIVSGDTLLVVDGKGESGHANADFDPFKRSRGVQSGYVASNLVGSVRSVAIPTDAELVAGFTQVQKNEQIAQATRPDPIVQAHGPIKHIIYIIKENRTYDQILGDVPNADGDAKLAVMGGVVTPNEHAIVERFGVFDRFFENSHVSADGHNWATAAIANDYLEKMWPANYSGRRKLYDFEDGAEGSVPHAGYLWDDAKRAHVSYRDYGEFVSEAQEQAGAKRDADGDEPIDVTTQEAALKGNIDANFPTFDMAITDMHRVAIWKTEFDGYVAAKNLPQLEIVRLPRDHTSGTRVGAVTPQGMIADNDQAVGTLVDIVSHSPYWRSTMVVAIEDDAQNGPDHVDEQRSTFYLATPYAKPGTHHVMYTQAGLLRTMEMILGMPPMTPYDATARPLYEAFQPTPNMAPFAAIPAKIDVNVKNTITAYRAADSAKQDWAHADRADPATAQDIVQHTGLAR